MTRYRIARSAIVAGLALSLLSGCVPSQPGVGLDVADVGWGPPRPLNAGTAASNHPVLNSVRDSSIDETQFIFLRDDETGAQATDMRPKIGDVIHVISYFDNSGGTASTGTTLTIDAPGVIGGRAAVQATLQSNNAMPGTVWSSLTLTPPDSKGVVDLRLLSGSAHLVVPARGVDVPLADDIFTVGTPIGCAGPDGFVDAGCSGYVTFALRIDRPDFEVVTQVRSVGDPTWHPSLTVRKGGRYEVRINFRNTGSTQLDDVTLSAVIPKGAWIDGTVRWGNDSHPEGWEAVGDVSGPGQNVGSHDPGDGAYIDFPIRIGPVVYCTDGDAEVVGHVKTYDGSKSSSLPLPVAQSVICV